ncbi:MAG: YgjV family protein [Candidatus Paceibacterota bacterium]
MAILIQLLAIIALGIWFSSYHFNSRKTILLVQLLSFVFWITHFILIEAYTGAALASVAALRLALFSFKTNTNWIGKPIVMWLFILLLGISTYFTLESLWGIAAFVGGVFAIVASWQLNTKKMRVLFIPSHLSWILYDIFSGSIGGAVAEGILCLSAIISLLRKRN